MNPFLLPAPERLKHWKEFRNSLAHLEDAEALAAVAEYWRWAPLLKMAYDPEFPTEWASPWEMINTGDWCVYSRAIGMEFTLRLAGWDKSRLKLVLMRDYTISEQLMVLKIDDSLALNYTEGLVVEYPNTDQTILVTWQFDGKNYQSL